MHTKWIIIVAALIVLGAVIGGVSAAAMHFDFTRLSTETYETKTYEIGESFRDISIRAAEDDIALLPSEDGACRVVCREGNKQRHEVSAENGTLLIESFDERAWYERIGIFSGKQDITVYLPAGAYGDLVIGTATGDVDIPGDFSFDSAVIHGSTADVDCSASVTGLLEIQTSTGDIALSGLTAGELRLSVSTGHIRASSVACAGSAAVHVRTGDVRLSDMTCRSLTSEGSTGDITLANVMAAESFGIERGTGGVRFEHSDAAEITVRTSTGDITGTLLTDKVFLADSSTGDVDVPRTTTGGRCELTTSTGDIQIAIG